MNKIKLSILNITGPLNLFFTPKCIIDDICLIYGIDQNETDNILEEINIMDEQQPTVNYHPNDDELQTISNFMNPFLKMEKESILSSFSIFKMYTNDTPLPGPNFVSGWPGYIPHYTLPSYIIYKLCIENSINTYTDQGLEHISTLLRLKLYPENISRKQLRSLCNDVHVDEIPNVYSMIIRSNCLVNIRDHNYSDNDPLILEDTASMIFSKNKLLKRYNPKNDNEALLLAAYNYDKDISLSSSKVYEYLNIRDMVDYQGVSWEPLDERMKYLYSKNKNVFSLNFYFNPSLPVDVYKEGQLNFLAKREGYSDRDIDYINPYTLLQTSYITDNFYQGYTYGIINDVTHIYSFNVDEIPNEELLCYGIKNNYLIAFHIDEIIDYFEKTKNFLNPFEIEKIHFEKIEKLKTICKLLLTDKSKKLLKIIELIELIERDITNSIKNIIDKQPNNIIYISVLFNLITECAFRCRGWLDNDVNNIPVEYAPVNDQVLVDTLVSESIYNLEKHSNNELYQDVMSLPIIQYINGKWIKVEHFNTGNTLGDRIRILKQGESTDDIESCMRTTSNYLLHTIYKFCEILDIKTNFNYDIENLSFTS